MRQEAWSSVAFRVALAPGASSRTFTARRSPSRGGEAESSGDSRSSRVVTKRRRSCTTGLCTLAASSAPGRPAPARSGPWSPRAWRPEMEAGLLAAAADAGGEDEGRGGGPGRLRETSARLPVMISPCSTRRSATSRPGSPAPARPGPLQERTGPPRPRAVSDPERNPTPRAPDAGAGRKERRAWRRRRAPSDRLPVPPEPAGRHGQAGVGHAEFAAEGEREAAGEPAPPVAGEARPL